MNLFNLFKNHAVFMQECMSVCWMCEKRTGREGGKEEFSGKGLKTTSLLGGAHGEAHAEEEAVRLAAATTAGAGRAYTFLGVSKCIESYRIRSLSKWQVESSWEF